jgi:hypothetical protein
MIHVNIALDKDDEWRIFAGNDRREQSGRLNAENVHDYIEMMDNARNDLLNLERRFIEDAEPVDESFE